jgi:hypothetical protein
MKEYIRVILSIIFLGLPVCCRASGHMGPMLGEGDLVIIGLALLTPIVNIAALIAGLASRSRFSLRMLYFSLVVNLCWFIFFVQMVFKDAEFDEVSTWIIAGIVVVSVIEVLLIRHKSAKIEK